MIKMKKLILIWALLLPFFAFGAAAQAAFNIVEDSANISGKAGQTLSGSFSVKNTGTTTLSINFTGLTLSKGSDTLAITSLANITGLAAGGTKTSGFSVIVPSGKPLGLYTGTLTGKSGTLSDTVQINADVKGTYSVSTVSQINFGSSKLNTTKKGSFDLTNTGDDALTKVSFKFSDSKFNFNADKSDFTISKGSTEKINFNLTIPKDSSTGNVTLGSVSIVSNELTTKLFDVKAEIGGGLVIDDLDVFLTTRDSERGSHLDVVDGKKLSFGEEDAGPGSELRFNFNIENTFSDDDNIDIKDIIVRVTIVDIEDGDDIEEESDDFSLDPSSNRDVDIFINIPISVDVGVYDIIIEVEGKDDEGNDHTTGMSLDLDINKEARAVVVSRASLFPNKVVCGGTASLTAVLKNLGKRREPEAKFEILNPNLGINYVQGSLALDEEPFDEDNEYTKVLPIVVDRNTKPGTYPIEIKAYIQEGIMWERRTVNLLVDPCGTQPVQEVAEQPEEGTNETVEVETEEFEDVNKTDSIAVPVLKPLTTTEIPLTKRPVFWVAVAAMNILVIAGIAFLIVKFVFKK
jgi:hypothetical protein